MAAIAREPFACREEEGHLLSILRCRQELDGLELSGINRKLWRFKRCAQLRYGIVRKDRRRIKRRAEGVEDLGSILPSADAGNGAGTRQRDVTLSGAIQAEQ